jgi:hypothetical protein
MISFAKVCQDALSFKEKPDAEIIELDQEIRAMRTTIPEVLRVRPLSDSITDPPFLIMTRLYIEFICLKSLCVLHRKYMARGNVFSTSSCIEAGERLVGLFIDMYKEFSPGGQLYTGRWMLNNFTVNDFLLGVMVLCLAIHTKRRKISENSSINNVTEGRVLALLEQSHSICVEKSPLSRGARRVAHAVRLTLNGSRSTLALESSHKSTEREGSCDQPVPNGGGENASDPAYTLPPWYGYLQSSETEFGFLDSFDFTRIDFEKMDWTSFNDKQI